ncbi:E3 ubiquitin-protein ligase rnf8-B-like [Aphis gossypii]|uniref:RING-type E3 ubiquitin transferase n=1 Tax=Aphis gossypii TaxID=80765 RepID=A0A9P0NN14_APHGO|nr:E3 ubiquitin-protein ligase rnf8-B-like [Aphis gossypii]CAH1732449.1 unnamed protein product [Aphis gossypii]
MNPEQKVCKYYLRKSCRYGDQCFNSHEKPPHSKQDDDKPILTFEVATSSKQQREQSENVQQTLTNKPTEHADSKSTENVNKTQPNESINTPPELDISKLTTEMKNLVKKINILETSVNTLRKQLREQQRANSDLINELNATQLHDEDFKCPICFEVFIRPSLLDCSHMFCEWCIDKSLEISDHCPICRERIIDYSYCLNTDNIIKRMIGLMPEKDQKRYKNVAALRAKDKPKSLELRALRVQFELVRLTLNGYVAL